MKGLLTILLCALTLPSLASLKEYYNTTTNDAYDANIDIYTGQTFTVGTVGVDGPYTLDSVAFKGYRSGSPGTTLVCLYATSGNAPVGSLLSYGMLDGNSLTDNHDGEVFYVDMDDYQLQDGVKYALYFIVSMPAGNEITLFAYYQASGSPYAGGGMIFANSAEYFDNIELWFEVYGTTVAEEGDYNPIAGRHYRVFDDGIERAPKDDGHYNYFLTEDLYIPAPNADSVPYIIFANNFNSLPTGSLSLAKKQEWNIAAGGWDDGNILVESFAGVGNALRIRFQPTTPGVPLANTRLHFDSVYHDVYIQYKFYVAGGFDWGDGGKMFGSIAGGKQVTIPYYFDTLNTGFATLKLFSGGGNFQYYTYQNSGTKQGWPLTETTQIPSDDMPLNYGLYGRDYSIGRDGDGVIYGWPSKTYWAGSYWTYIPGSGFADKPGPGTNPGTWHTISERVRFGTPNGWDDIYEVAWDGVVIYSEDNTRYVVAENQYWGAEAMYLNGFFGGDQPSPTTQSWYIDDIVAYTIPAGHESFTANKRNVGSSFPIISSTDVVHTSPATPKTERYTDQIGIVYSHNPAFHTITMNKLVYKTISVAGATQYGMTMTHYTPSSTEVGVENRNYVRIYSYNNGVAALHYTYDATHTTLMAHEVDCDSIVIQYYSGNDQPNFVNPGFIMTYTTDGTGSGNNPVYPTPQNMIATKPE